MTLRSRTFPVRRHGNLATALLMMAMVCIFGVSAPSARAQADPLESVGIRPVSTQLPVQNGYVDLTNGDLHLEIPLGTFAQRGGGQVKFSLIYDSALWSQGSGTGWSSLFINGYPWDYGWRLVSSADAGGIQYTETPGDPCPTDHTNGVYYLKNFTYSASDGTTHVFPTSMVITLGFTNKCGSHSSSYGGSQAIDASGYYLNYASTGATVYSPSGEIVYSSDNTVVPLPGRGYAGTMDTNGNYITPDSSVAYGLVDTLGRVPVVMTPNGNTTTITVLNSTGGTSTYTITGETINVWTDFASAGSGIGDYKGSGTTIQKIALPDGTSYSFGYDSGTTQGHYGQLTSMTMPTGGQISYSYATFDDSEWNAWGKHVTRGISTMTTPDSTVPWQFTPQVIVQCATNIVNCQQSMTVAEPSGDHSVYTFNINAGIWPTEVQFYNGSISASNLLATQTQTFDYSQPSGYPNGQAENVTKTSATVTLPLPGGTSLSRTTKYVWDTTTNDGNLKQQSEWNFYSGSLPTSADRITNFTYQSGSAYLAAHILNRVANVTVTDKNGATVSQTVNTYDGSAVGSAAGFAHHDDANYGTGKTVRGNLTQVQRLISGTSNYLTTSNVVDMTGNVTTSTDSNNNPTTYNYADNFYTDAGDGSNPMAFTPPGPTNAYLKTVTQGGLVSTFGYYWGKGQKALSTDPNLQTTYYHFHDSLDRPTSKKFPDNGWTYSVYPSGSETEIDTGTGITSATLSTNCPASSSACRHDEVLLDSLGRKTSKLLVSDPLGQVTVATVYDSDGRVQKGSNPYRTTSDSTYGWQTPTYDGLNRTVQTLEADGSIVKSYYGAAVGSAGGLSTQLCTSSAYGLGYPVLKVDEAGKIRQSWTDGFGRLIEVDEPNSSGTLSVPTCYSYDLNNNLIGVAQSTVTRSFSYDLLSRLTTAYNPEANTINYYYTTAAGSLCSGDLTAVCRRTDAKSITTTYAYDTLNRLTSKTYSDSTHAISYSYDGTTCIGASTCYNKGRRTGMTDAAGSETWSYDTMGRIWGDKRTTNSITNQMLYAYNLDGSLATLTYPSGRIITYTYNSAAQPIGAADNANEISYVSDAFYAPHGALTSRASGVAYTILYNSRLQPCWSWAGSGTSLPLNYACTATATAGTILDLKYSYNLGADNGNVVGITNDRDTTRSQTITYDQLNRISMAQTTSTYSTSPAHCWGELFTYDQRANFLSIGVSSSAYTGCTQQSLSVAVNASNQISSPSGYVYDLNGNLTTVPAPGSASYTYNAENEMTSTAGVNYIYDGDGHRIEKSNGKLYWYGNGGKVLEETDLSGSLTSEYVFFGGTRVARRDSPSNNIFYYFGDQLGTSRAIVQSGQTAPCYDADFYPFGGERTPIVNTCTQNYKFTGKERDSESSLDNFGARYYMSSQGRFITPDWSEVPAAIPYANLSDPQSINLYVYVRDNPLRFSDADGHCFFECLKNLFLWQVWTTDDKVEAALQKRADELRQTLAKQRITYNGVLLTPNNLNGYSNKDVVTLAQDYFMALGAGEVGVEVVHKGKTYTADVHHLLPQATEFRKYFDDADLNIEDYTIDLPRDLHIDIHSGEGMGRGGAWNNAWREFFRNNPNANGDQIMQQMNRMADEFGLRPYDLDNMLKDGEEPIE